MKVIQYNPFRYLGLFSNATLKEQTAMATKQKAYARVGQKMENPLRLTCLWGELPDDEETLTENESRLTLPDERERHAFFWFAHGPDPEEDLKAVDLLDKGMMREAMVIWENRNDREALQNLMVTALLREDLKEATHLAQQLHQKEPDIRRFALALTDEFKWLTMQMLRDYASGNDQWTAVLRDMQVDGCRKNIEESLDNAKHKEDLDTYEALYEATKDLDQLRELLGPDDVTYQTLADQLAIALIMDKFEPFRLKNPFKWFDRAYEISVLEETRTRVMCVTFSYLEMLVSRSLESKKYSREYRSQLHDLISYNGPIVDLREGIKEKIKERKKVVRFRIGCVGSIVVFVLIVLYFLSKRIYYRFLIFNHKRVHPPEIEVPAPVQLPDPSTYYHIDIPTVPYISGNSFDQADEKLQETDLMVKYRSLDSSSLHTLKEDFRLNEDKYRYMDDKEMEKVIDELLESSSKSSEGKTTPTDSVNE